MSRSAPLLALLAILLAAVLALPASTRAQPVDLFLTAGPPFPADLASGRWATIPALAARSPAAVFWSRPAPQGAEISALACTQALADPGVSLAPADSPWLELRDARSFVTDHFSSSPQALLMVEDNDDYREADGDVDSAGQSFAVPAGAELLYGSLRYRVSGSPAAGEEIELALYSDDTLAPAARVARFSVATAGQTNTWLSLDWELTEAEALKALRESGEALLAISLRSRDGATQRVWVDDIRANVCVGAAAISGRVTQGGATTGLDDARILLVRSDGTREEVLAVTSPDAAGRYRFDGLPALAAGARYRVWFLNSPTGGQSGRIGFWAGPSVAGLAGGQELELAAFDIGDIELGEPASYSEVAASASHPASLSWAARGVTDERYQLCLYDPARLDQETDGPVQLCGPIRDPARDPLSFSLSPASFAGAPEFGFSYGRSYRWYVVALKLGTDGRVEQYGYSFYEQAITLVEQEVSPPSVPVDAEPDLPSAPTGSGDWTLMVYAAGDNALGDIGRTPGISGVDVQLAHLAALAPRYPRVRIVVFADRYGDTGARLCYLRPSGGPDCRERAEPNSADPATLRDFVAMALERYPARRAMLWLIGPGHAVGGFGTDQTAEGSPAMSVDAIGAAIEQASAAAGRSADILVAQAPLMGELTAAASLAGAADFLVAASDQIWQLAWFDRALPLLAGTSRDNPRAISQGLVAAYDAAVVALGTGRARSIAAYDLERAAAARAALDKLGTALAAGLNGDPTATMALLDGARNVVQRYDSSGNGLIGRMATAAAAVPADEDAFFDAAGLAEYLAGSPLASETIREAAEALGELVSGDAPMVLASQQRSGLGLAGEPIDLNNAGGLALLLPGPAGLGGQRTLAEIALSDAEGGWAMLLKTYLTARPAASPGGVTAGPLGGARFAPPLGGRLGFSIWLPLVERQE